MIRVPLAAAVVLIAVGCASSPAPNQAWALVPASAVPSAEQVEVPGEEKFKANSLSVILRAVTEERASGGMAIGLEYGRRIRENWGIGGFAEYVAGDFQVGVFGLAAFYHPTERWGIAAGPGYEYSKEEERWLARVGTYYEFDAGEIIIAPAIYLDWIEGAHQAILAGINFGKRF